MTYYAPRIQKAARAVLAGLPPHVKKGVEFDELVQAGVERVLRAIESYFTKPRIGPVAGYIYEHALGGMKDDLRRMDGGRKARRAGEPVVRVTRDADTAGDGEGPSLMESVGAADDVTERRRAEALEVMCNGLDQQQQQVLRLWAFGGMQIPQIAMRLRMSEDAALAVQTSVVRRLREQFREREQELVELLS